LPLIVALTYKCAMGCFYCNAQGLGGIFKEEMSIDNFIKLLGWIKKQRIHKIMFVGGEPTQHTRFADIMSLSKKANLACYMASNCAYGKNINEAVAKNIDVLFVNCSTRYSAEKRSDLLDKLRFLSQHGTKLILRVNIATTDEDTINWIRPIARELGARIRIAIINSSTGLEKPIDAEKIRSLVFFAEGFAKQCLKENIYIYLARPLPRCFFDAKKWQELRRLILVKSKCFVGYRGNYASRVVINPDLSVFGCFKNLNKAESILSFPGLIQLSGFYKVSFEEQGRQCILNTAGSCIYLAGNECNGACLDYA